MTEGRDEPKRTTPEDDKVEPDCKDLLVKFSQGDDSHPPEGSTQQLYVAKITKRSCLVPPEQRARLRK